MKTTEQTAVSAITRKSETTYTVNGHPATLNRVFEKGKWITKLTYSTNSPINDTRK